VRKALLKSREKNQHCCYCLVKIEMANIFRAQEIRYNGMAINKKVSVETEA